MFRVQKPTTNTLLNTESEQTINDQSTSFSSETAFYNSSLPDNHSHHTPSYSSINSPLQPLAYNTSCENESSTSNFVQGILSTTNLSEKTPINEESIKNNGQSPSYQLANPIQSSFTEDCSYQQSSLSKLEQPKSQIISTTSSSSSPPPPPPYSPPIVSVYSMSMQQPAGSSIITQVSNDQNQGFLDPGLSRGLQFGNNIKLDLRGQVIELTRTELSQLPESILLGISNGLCTDYMGNIMFSNEDGEIATVNFSPECLEYTLKVFRAASLELQSWNEKKSKSLESDYDQEQQENIIMEEQNNIADLLDTKPAIIVLREDLDYYCIPPRPGMTSEEMIAIKKECGKRLVDRNEIFNGLRNGSRSGTAEQHLIDMLCSSGFDSDERWGFRALEPNKTVISSLSLVRLEHTLQDEAATKTGGVEVDDMKTGDIENSSVVTEVPKSESVEAVEPVVTNDDNKSPPEVDQKIEAIDTLHPVESNQTQSAIPKPPPSREVPAHEEEHQDQHQQHEQPQSVQSSEIDMSRTHKLLLFWRKPARKCWWDIVFLEDIPNVEGPVKVHLRSVWTLELSVIEH